MGVRLAIGTVAVALLLFSVNLGGWPLAAAAFLILAAAATPRRVWTGRPSTTGRPRAAGGATTDGDGQQ